MYLSRSAIVDVDVAVDVAVGMSGQLELLFRGAIVVVVVVLLSFLTVYPLVKGDGDSLASLSREFSSPTIASFISFLLSRRLELAMGVKVSTMCLFLFRLFRVPPFGQGRWQ